MGSLITHFTLHIYLHTRQKESVPNHGPCQHEAIQGNCFLPVKYTIRTQYQYTYRWLDKVTRKKQRLLKSMQSSNWVRSVEFHIIEGNGIRRSLSYISMRADLFLTSWIDNKL